MSTNHTYDERTGTDRPQIDYHAIAARIGADAEELRLFVQDHPNPTAPVVLGWAHADPQHREAVERWLTTREAVLDGRVGDLSKEIDKHQQTAYQAAKEGGK